MKQLSMFKTEVSIPGLKYLPEYITEKHELELINIIDSNEWLTELKRRVQHYGYKYDYKNRFINAAHYLGSIPDWLQDLCLKLHDEGIFIVKPDQVIINEYTPGQGISPHIDCISCFSNTICSISLGSACVMDFVNEERKESIMLSSRSLLVISGEARYKWKHGIAARKSDKCESGTLSRQRRISLTFRKVVL